MTNRKAPVISLIVVVLLTQGLLIGQTAQSNAERIRQLREEISKRETADVPNDLVDLNRDKLIERRAELRTLLKVEIESLKKHRVLLAAAITPEETQKIDDSIRGYSSEIDRLNTAIRNALSADNLTSPPSNATSTVSVSQPPTNVSAPASTAPEASGTPGALQNNMTNAERSNAVSNHAGIRGLSNPPTSIPPPIPADVTDTKATIDCQQATLKPKTVSELDKTICGIVDDIAARKVAGAPNQISLRPNVLEVVKIIIARKSTPKYLVEAEETRLDKQVAAGPSNTNGNSLIVKGGTPAILGFAVENGGLSRTANGSAITFRGNPVGLINAFANRGFVPSVKEDEKDSLLRFMKKTSFAFTFNTDRGPNPGVFTATQQQLSSFSARIEFINRRKADLYIRDWEDFLGTKAQSLANYLSKNQLIETGIDESVFPFGKWKDPILQAWWVQTQTEMAKASDAEVSAVLQASLEKLPIKQLLPETIAILSGVETQLGLYMSGRDDLLKKINRGTLVTFEYVNKREVNAPDTSNFTFIAEKGTGGGAIDFTFNASLTMFNNMDSVRNFVRLNPLLPRPGRVRDFQFAGQIDVPIGSVTDFGQFDLFASGRYERLLENASTDIGLVIPNTKGDIGYLQVGVKVPIKGTGLKIPFSVTFANRTELIKEKTVRGNIGFTFDLDSLFSRFKPF